MATFKPEVTSEQSVPLDEDDIRGDGKKRKFKPLSAVRRFFRPKKKKDDSVVAVKANSTTAIPAPDDDDDDDGGFKSHGKPIPLAGARSLSEDSVFSTEARDSINRFPITVASDDNIPKTSAAFQSELLSKLNKRRSLYSDDERDDGLPKSPVPPLNTSDVISQKPGTSGKKSNTLDSDQSLISVDSSENEEDLFAASNWKSRVAAKKSADQKPLSNSSDSGMDSIDFCSIQKTEVLNNSAAKDKISIKPKARNRQSRKKRDTSSPQTLPSLNEESPTKQLPDDTSSVPSVSSGALESDSKLKSSSPRLTKKIDTNGLQLNLNAVSPSSKAEKLASGAGVAAPLVGTPPVGKASTPQSPGFKSSIYFKPPDSQVSSTPLSPTSPSIKSFSEINLSEKSGLDKFSSRGNDRLPLSGSIHIQGSSIKEDEKPSMDLKSRMNQFEVKGQTVTEPALKVSDPDSMITMSPKEDYKQRRQMRSKTLPGTTEEQASPRVQRTSSHRIQISGSSSPEHPVLTALSLASEKGSSSPTTISPQTPPVSSVKKLENLQRFGSPDIHTAEPLWIRKKKDDQDSEESISKNIVSESIKTGQGIHFTKSGSLTGSLMDKKVETVSFKHKENTPEKKVDKAVSEWTSDKMSLSKKESLEMDTNSASQEVKTSSVVTAAVPSTSGSDKTKMSLGSGSFEKEEVTKPNAKDISQMWGGGGKLPAKSNEILFSNRSGSIKTPSSISSSLGFKMMTAGSQQTLSTSKQVKPDVPLTVKPESASISSAAPLTASYHASLPSSTLTSSTPSVTASVAASNIKPGAQSAKGSSSFAFTSKPFGAPPSQTSSKPVTSPVSPPQPALFGAKPYTFKPPASDALPAVSTPPAAPAAPIDTQAPAAVSSTAGTSSSRSHSSFTTSAAFKPQASTTGPSLSSRLASPSKPTLPSDNKVASEEKKPETIPGVPAWRANLKNDSSKNEVKIEIIEKTPSNADILRKGSEKSKSTPPSKKNEVVVTGGGGTLQLDTSSNRSSKVMDMVKNFQNLKITS